MKGNRVVVSDPRFPDLPIRPWWRRHLFKTTAITILCITAYYILEHQLGEHAWTAYQQEAAAKGIKLQFADFETPDIPDEENYAAAPIFRNLFTPGVAAATSKQFDLPNLSRPNVKGKGKSKTMTAAMEPKPLDFEDWQQAFVKAGWVSSPGKDPASDVLAALERIEGPLEQIRRASPRPKTHWPVKWSDGPDVQIPILGTLQGAGRCFAFRAKALLALDRPDQALSEIRHIVREAESLRGQPSIIFALVRIALWNLALETAEQGIQANKWPASHLVELSELFGATNHLADWKVSLSGERCFMNCSLDRVVDAAPTAFGKELGDMLLLNAGKPMTILLGASPRGWIRRAQVGFDREIEDIDSIRELIDPRFSRAMTELTHTSALDALNLSKRLAMNLAPYFYAPGSYRTFALHTRAQQFLILCALTRYREAHGRLPESLADLVPTYLNAVPHDIMDGQPMRYRRLDGGGGLLWSIGSNRIDDGGSKGDSKRSPHAPDWVAELSPISDDASK
jgi:hypothetical protein